MRVMIVDDAVTARLKIHHLLNELGYTEVQLAESALQALDLFPILQGLDLLFVDWNMPEMSGLQLIKHVRSLPDYQATQIIMVTTETEMGYVIEALEAGANEYIMKPFSREMLRDKLQILGLSIA